MHALSYVSAAALAGHSQADGEDIYKRWIQAVWAGDLAFVVTELETRSAALGPPTSECGESDPCQLVFESLRYLKNNAHRMKYIEYRLAGLPIMTNAMESGIKMINIRVKDHREASCGLRRCRFMDHLSRLCCLHSDCPE